MRPDEARLVQRARAHDQDAFGCIVERYKERVCSTAYQILGSYHDADDVTQEVFLYAYEHLADFRGQAALSTWLYRITVSLSLQRLRRRRVQAPLEAARAMTAKGRSPADEAASREVQGIVSAAIDALRPRQKVVAVLHILQGLPLTEVAKVLGIPAATARWRLYRARKVLRHKLRPLLEQ